MPAWPHTGGRYPLVTSVTSTAKPIVRAKPWRGASAVASGSPHFTVWHLGEATLSETPPDRAEAKPSRDPTGRSTGAGLSVRYVPGSKLRRLFRAPVPLGLAVIVAGRDPPLTDGQPLLLPARRAGLEVVDDELPDPEGLTPVAARQTTSTIGSCARNSPTRCTTRTSSWLPGVPGKGVSPTCPNASGLPGQIASFTRSSKPSPAPPPAEPDRAAARARPHTCAAGLRGLSDPGDDSKQFPCAMSRASAFCRRRRCPACAT